MAIVKNVRRRGRTRISVKNQATIPVAALRRAGLKPDDELRVDAAGAGRILVSRVDEARAAYAGARSVCLTPSCSQRRTRSVPSHLRVTGRGHARVAALVSSRNYGGQGHPTPPPHPAPLPRWGRGKRRLSSSRSLHSDPSPPLGERGGWGGQVFAHNPASATRPG